MIKLAIVEGSAELCTGLRRLFAVEPGIACVCACQDAETALRTIPDCEPDVVIMEVSLPEMDGIECTARLKRVLPTTKVLIFTGVADDERIFRALEAGADGYLLKRTPPPALVAAVRELKAGGAPMSAEIARKVVVNFHKARSAMSATASANGLTRREAAVLALLAEGSSAKEIGTRLAISPETVNVHLKHVYQKLNVRSRLEAVIKFRSF